MNPSTHVPGIQAGRQRETNEGRQRETNEPVNPESRAGLLFRGLRFRGLLVAVAPQQSVEMAAAEAAKRHHSPVIAAVCRGL